MPIRIRCASILLMFCGVFGGELDETETILVMKGDSVSLHTGLGEVNREMQIMWMFGPEKANTLIAEIHSMIVSIYDSYEELKDRVQMSQRTGSLTIRNTSISHSGLYEAQIMTTVTAFKRFHVIVHDGGFPCAVLCSAENGPGVSLSWYKDGERLNQTSGPDLNFPLSVLLEIKERSKDVYQCVAANPISNKTTPFSFQEHCPQHTDSSRFCGSTEIAIRLVVSMLMGVATVALVIYDVRSGGGVNEVFQC
ncbi:hepatocyte cell adhesion molecule-like isoform 2 precursor [Danio rerio]|uniref:Hepatocyte cell adhesion molecule-like isoform 2 precursor n=1 Tax=Danio rerio TaxID=7955 RepID=A0AB13AAN2_DANRE|nr:hepatocyte cell adhesion molecule-like isoform 2 precursor [Danio rerio]|eukprot:XP_005161899.1 hepatocyte cell adhesion molecule-like [Danio rerio]